MAVRPIRSAMWELPGGLAVVTGDTVGVDASKSPDESDAAARGWVEGRDGSRDPALFVLAGTGLGVSDLRTGTLPEWFDLRDVASLDAVGDPTDGLQPVEFVLADGRTVRAGWTEDFSSRVVDALVATIADSDGAPVEPVVPAPAGPAAPAASASTTAAAAPTGPVGPVTSAPTWAAAPSPSAPAPAPAPAAQAPLAPVAPVAPLPVAENPESTAPESRTPESPTPASNVPGSNAPGSSGQPSEPATESAEPASDAQELNATALVLEDVTYLGGYPGQDKKRKGCTVTMTREVVELSGPKGIAFRIGWEVVRTLEAQNADVARFRMNTKIHRDATALVLECDQEMTLLLEARDCPTIPLRGAIVQLIDDLPVVIV